MSKTETILPPEAEHTADIAPLAVPIAGVSKLLGISDRSAWQLVKDKKIRSFKLGTRLLVPVAAVQDFIDEQIKSQSETAEMK